ncbi:MAG: RNA methyltransferase [Oscillospiraceae bacterium]|nr:RNA methyltransferase [Oscillospiraceae bacterium]
METKLKTYKKDSEYSYALGASLTIELLENRPDDCFRIIFSPFYIDKNNKIKNLCEKHKILCEENQKSINILSPKENCYVIGAFQKRNQKIDKNKSHVVLDNPSDMGNLGTIMRSCAGFGIENIAIIGNGADCYNPKVIRASMGAFFHVNTEYFTSINDYIDFVVGARIARPPVDIKLIPSNGRPLAAPTNINREIYTFMLDGEYNLNELILNKNNIFSLIFGNEASGLDYNIYKNIGKSVVISHTDKIDSLNLPIAVSIALFWFGK